MRALPFLAVAAVFGAGCNHITTRVPGVIDLRSDASEMPVDNSQTKGERSGFDSVISGDGVTGSGNVKVEDRRYWVCGLLPIGSQEVAPEVSSAMGNGGLRNAHIGEQMSVEDIGVRLVVNILPVVNLLGIVLPAFDVTVDGTHIKTDGIAATPPGDAPPPIPPDGSAPVPAPLAPGEE